MLATESDDIRFGRVLARFQSDKGFRSLTPFLIRNSYDGALQDGRVPGDRLLDFDGRDVFATRDDNVLLAVAQFDIAIGMPYADIARMEPATSKYLGGCIRIYIVALNNVVAVHHHLAHSLTIDEHSV